MCRAIPFDLAQGEITQFVSMPSDLDRSGCPSEGRQAGRQANMVKTSNAPLYQCNNMLVPEHVNVIVMYDVGTEHGRILLYYCHSRKTSTG